jgi:hypothetical protein
MLPLPGLEVRPLGRTESSQSLYRLRYCGSQVRIGEIRIIYKILIGKHEGKKTQRRPRHRWDDIKVKFKKLNKAWLWI